MSRLRIGSVVGVVLLLAACGSDGGGDATTASGEGGMTLSITAPEDGAEVSPPFTVQFDSSEELGPTEDGVHHVHIYWDGDDSEYTVVEADSFEITEAPDGEHTLSASLRNADHSPAGVEAEISVTVGGGDGSGADKGDDGGISY
ncbi:MAG TPA: hypothetical protein VFS43_02115 [Polyangiaceae bacterium]|nr:hypothetical protein [Polyangiaceae bacterium]